MPDGFQPLSREELEPWKSLAGFQGAAVKSALHYLARCAELERERDEWKAAADGHMLDALDHYKARAAAEAALRDTEAKLGELADCILEYGLWEPGRKGHAAAHTELLGRANAVLAAVQRPEGSTDE